MNDNTRSDPLAPAVGAQVERPVGRLVVKQEIGDGGTAMGDTTRNDNEGADAAMAQPQG
jgi:hypothetical protein